MPDAYVLAAAFHAHYERMAPAFDYETRPESRTEWEKVPIRNRILMTLTAAVRPRNPAPRRRVVN